MRNLNTTGKILSKQQFSAHMRSLQDKITHVLSRLDPGLELTEDLWTREDVQGQDGGGGRTRAFSGEEIEKAGVNTSEVYGKVDPDFSKRAGGDGEDMWAAGLSLIIHPSNPKIPTVHANFRCLEMGSKFWFGGGADLTPYYPHEEDFHHFHQIWKTACQPFGTYSQWKKACDEYFVNRHREGEMRGIGGIFFDHLSSGDFCKDAEMVCALAECFEESYFPIAFKRKGEAFTSEDRDFQFHRRGRYVEFNLLHDRGTHFGLQTKGRTESILISLPPRCHFTYNYQPTNPVHQKMMTYYWPCQW